MVGYTYFFIFMCRRWWDKKKRTGTIVKDERCWKFLLKHLLPYLPTLYELLDGV